MAKTVIAEKAASGQAASGMIFLTEEVESEGGEWGSPNPLTETGEISYFL